MLVELENIVTRDGVVVMIVQISQVILRIQVIDVVIIVDGHVTHDTIKVETHVMNVEYENGHMHDMQRVMIVQINQVIHIILENQRVIVVHGHVILDTI